MKKKDLKHIEKRLLQLRERALKDLGHYDESFSNSKEASDGDVSAYSFHMADQGTDAMEREKAFLFASKEGRYLYHLDEALRRLYRTPKEFGVCEDCGDADLVRAIGCAAAHRPLHPVQGEGRDGCLSLIPRLSSSRGPCLPV